MEPDAWQVWRHPINANPPFPTRGVEGGWKDVFDEPDDFAALHAQMDERGRILLIAVAQTKIAMREERAPHRS